MNEERFVYVLTVNSRPVAAFESRDRAESMLSLLRQWFDEEPAEDPDVQYHDLVEEFCEWRDRCPLKPKYSEMGVFALIEQRRDANWHIHEMRIQ